METRNFQLDTEWNVIHYPEKPTGFAIFILGDERHFVDDNNSFWLQNEGKLTIINKFKESGYIIFSSNLYGRNWGSNQAVELALKLYEYVNKREIINRKIHILAEGMGALVAIKLLEKMGMQLRSVVFLNPILSLKLHLELEKEHKFFYKKLSKELESAYQKDFKQLEAEICGMEDIKTLDFGVPIKMIHVLSGGRSFNQAKLYQNLIKYKYENPDISTSFILPEKQPRLGSIMVKYFTKYEKIL